MRHGGPDHTIRAAVTYYGRMHTDRRLRWLAAPVIALGLVGGGVAISQVAQADQVLPAAPASQSVPASPQPSPTTATSPAATTSQASTSPSSSPSATPSATPSSALENCRVTDAQIAESHPDAEPRDENGVRNYYQDGVLVASTQDGKGWRAPCWVS